MKYLCALGCVWLPTISSSPSSSSASSTSSPSTLTGFVKPTAVNGSKLPAAAGLWEAAGVGRSYRGRFGDGLFLFSLHRTVLPSDRLSATDDRSRMSQESLFR